MSELRAVVIVDDQNVHLVGHGLYDSTRHVPKHETLIDPLLFAGNLLRVRNASQRADAGCGTAPSRGVQWAAGG